MLNINWNVNRKNPMNPSEHLWMCSFVTSAVVWHGMSKITGGVRERNKDDMNTTLQLLRNPCPALCLHRKEQVLSWTQEREERQNGEGRRRGAALTDPQSPETATDWNHRL